MRRQRDRANLIGSTDQEKFDKAIYRHLYLAKKGTDGVPTTAQHDIGTERGKCVAEQSAGIKALDSHIFPGDLDCVTRIPCYTAASRLPALVRRSELQEIPMPDKNTPLRIPFGLTNLKPVESEVALTFPDGAKREFPKNITGLDIARASRRRWPSARWRWRWMAWSPTLPTRSSVMRKSNSSPATTPARWS
jgi:hypothetical protein